MEDEDSECRVMESWSILDDLGYRHSTIDDTISHFNNISAYSDGIEEREDQCHTICPQDPNNKNSDLNSKIVFKGFKKRILAQTQENENTLQISAIQEHRLNPRNPKDKKEKIGKVNEYAQYLGLQPSPNLVQSLNSVHQFEPSLNSQRSHNSNLQNSNSHKSTCFKCHSSGNFLSKKQQTCTCSSTMIPVQGIASTSDLPSSQLSNKFKIQRKVYLCSACGTYFENWNLYLHMKDVHQRHLCLFCLGLFDHAERLSHHLMKNHSIPETSFTSVEEFYQIFKGSCYLICCSCEKVFTEKDNFYNHFCTSPQKVQVTKNVCSICRQVDGNHMTTCGLAPGSDSEVSLTPGSPEEIITYKNKLSGKGAAKKLTRINRISSAAETLVNHFQNKKVDLETKKASVKLQKESQTREIRKEDVPSDTEVSTNSTRDTVAETIMEVSRYTGESENNEREEERVSEEKTSEPEVSSENLQKKYDSYIETIMEVSRVGISEKSLITEDDEEDPAKSVSLNESTNTVSDENKEDEIKSSNPKDEDDVRLPATSPQDHHSDPNHDKNQDSENQNNLEINSASNSPISSPSNRSLLSPHRETQATDLQSKVDEEEGEEEEGDEVEVEEEEEEEDDDDDDDDEEEAQKSPEPVQRISDYQSFNTVTKTDRSLVIKICTNKNSQFSIAPRVDENSFNAESEENNNRESSASEEKSSERGRESPGSFHLNECDSDSDSEKLAVVDSNAENQDQPQDQESKMEIEETEKEEKEEDEVPETIETKPEENDGIVLAGEDIPFIELNVEDIPENMDPEDLLRKCLEAASVFCVYCYHARQIAVNGKQLGLHLLSEHRFQPQHPAVILQCEQVISKIKKSLNDLESQCFNLDSYNSAKGTYNIPNPRTYECFHCRHYSLLHKDIYLHNRKMHQKSILICIMCKSTFYSYSELLCHLCPGIYSPNENVRYRCCLCPVNNLPSAFRLMVHLRKKHHTCDVCLESTGNQQRLSNHVWKHKLHHLCYRCGIAYRNKPDITKHLFWKHGTESVLCKKCLQKKWPHVFHFCIPPTAFVCEECNLSFSRAVALKVHKRLHSGDSPYVCSECSERFISRKLLARHEEKHKEQPVIEEPIPEVKEETNVVEKPEKENLEPEVKTSDGENVEVKDVKEPVKKVDVYDLPPLNLSSDSDSDSEDEKPNSEVMKEEEKKPEKEDSEGEKNPDQLLILSEEKAEPKNDEIIQETVTQIDNIVHVELNEEEKKEEAQIMDGIWDNFKTYAASIGIQDASIPAKGTDTDIEFLKSVILADHDYCTVTLDKEKSLEENAEDQAKARSKTPEISKSPEKPEIKTGYEQEANKKKLKASKKRKKNDSSSSSDSSSDSDSSSCSCGSNCSCSSSSGSSSSSSSSSDSDSSASASSPKKKKKEKDKSKSESIEVDVKESSAQENGTADEIIEPGEPQQPAMRESDLETDESETDEDFYDEHPQQLANKLLAEKRNQLLAAVAPVEPPTPPPAPLNNGAVFDTSPAPVDDPNPSSVRKKVKTKKRKKADKGKQKVQIVESIKLNIPKSFYQKKPGPNSSPSVITVQPSRSSTPIFLAKETNDSVTPKFAGNSSETENNKRSSTRKRIPKRFYGDSSDEENEKQIPKWRKVEPVFSPITKPPIQPQIQRIVTPPFVGTTLTLKRTATNYKIEEPVVSASESEEEPVESSSSSESESEAEERAQIHVPQHHPPNPERADNLYCYCQCPYDEVSEMIACDGSDCRIEWFHFECVGIMVPPKGKWYCPDCRKRLGILDNYDEIANHQ